MAKKIAIFGGSFNPPGLHHIKIVQELRKIFDEIFIVPCGPRPDKETVNDVSPIHRAVMVDMAFGNLPNVKISLLDLEKETFTRTQELQKIFQSYGDVWHAIGTDLIDGGADGKSFIQRAWHNGVEIWNNLQFVVIPRGNIRFDKNNCPPKSRVIDLRISGSSSEIREKVFKHQCISRLVVPEIEKYIVRYGLYRGRFPATCAPFVLDEPRLLIKVDKNNAKAFEIASKLRKLNVGLNNPNLIAVIGGDGTMLHAVRNDWRKRLPFFGINIGHRGFLLNNTGDDIEELFKRELVVHQLPLLSVEITGADSNKKQALAFNDVWMERKSGQSAWLQVKINGITRIAKLVGDGILLSTMSGSTGYAKAMGAAPLSEDSSDLVLVGSNVMEPANWKSANLPGNSILKIDALNTDKRPVEVFVDGISQGRAIAFAAKASRIACAELVFSQFYDISEKRLRLQFQ